VGGAEVVAGLFAFSFSGVRGSGFTGEGGAAGIWAEVCEEGEEVTEAPVPMAPLGVAAVSAGAD
jgi:hypothetical protein